MFKLVNEVKSWIIIIVCLQIQHLPYLCKVPHGLTAGFIKTAFKSCLFTK